MGTQLLAHLPLAFGRNPCPQLTVPNLGPRQDDRPSGNHGVLANHRMVHHRGPHANERPLLNVGPVDNGVVSEAHVVVQPCFTLAKRAVHNHAVLDVDPFADVDGRHVSSKHSLEPHGAVPSQAHLANHGGVGRKPSAFMKDWGVPADREDGGHGRKLPSLARHPSDVHRRPDVFVRHRIRPSPIGVGLGQLVHGRPDPHARLAMDLAVQPPTSGIGLPGNALAGEGAADPIKDVVPSSGARSRIVTDVELNGEAFKQGC